MMELWSLVLDFVVSSVRMVVGLLRRSFPGRALPSPLYGSSLELISEDTEIIDIGRWDKGNK